MINWQNILKLFSYDRNNPILFNSGLFLLLFTIFLLIYTFTFNRKTLRTIYVICFSLYFYYKTSGEYAIILILSILINFFLALAITGAGKKYQKNLLFIFSILVNVSVLGYFKYANFILENIGYITKGEIGKLEIFLPIGISFYTFQTLSYLIDVKRDTIKPTKNILDYSFYISFFPTIVAGPIVRTKDLLSQIAENVSVNKEEISSGLYLITRGLIKKAIFATYISQYCDLIYGMPGNYSGFENLIAMYGYTMQIYLDFSGYSDMAIGIAKIMGFKIKDNFNSPYSALNIIDFWKRWHISLSTWLRDYLFLPISYSYLRRTKNTKISLVNSYILASLITMFIAGLWHGASWKFIFWGTAHGAGLIINKLYQLTIGKKRRMKKYFPNWLSWFITFHFVAFLWIFFRAGTFDEALVSITTIFGQFDPAYILPFIQARTIFSILLVTGMIFTFIPFQYKENIKLFFFRAPLIVKAVVFILIIQLIIQFQSESVQPFIYFQF
jgi:D-alanyl-lipoteichoic acid acyltransferase DltB (MBOAT superfamily)